MRYFEGLTIAIALLLVSWGVHAESPLAPVHHSQAASITPSRAFPASTPVEPTIGKAAGAEADSKTLANGLTLSGSWLANWSYTGASGDVSILVPRINNDSATRTTGTMRLDFWAATTLPGRGQAFSGFRLFTSSTISPLAPRSFYTDVVRSGTFLVPPNGTYYLVLVLMEFDPTNCAAADSYCIADSQNAALPETFGTPAGPYTDLWWNPAESGWGVTITHHPSGVVFATWFTYDNLGVPYWYVASDCRMVGNTCTATLYETVGPAFNGPYNPALVTIRSAGTVTFTFSGANFGLMSYSVKGVTASKFITRQGF